MFVVIGLAGSLWACGTRGIATRAVRSATGGAPVSGGAPEKARLGIVVALFKRRTTRGMIWASPGELYRLAVYRVAAGLSGSSRDRPAKPAGWRRSVSWPRRWACGSMKQVVDALARSYDATKRSRDRADTFRARHAAGEFSPTQAVRCGAVCVHFARTSAWGLVQVMVSENKVASVAVRTGSFVSPLLHRSSPLGGGYHALSTWPWLSPPCVTFAGAVASSS